MSGEGEATYVICYDVRDPKRLARLHRMLKKHALAVQYSVFGARMGSRGLQALLRKIRQEIDSSADDVRLYRTPEDCEVELAGRDGQTARHVLFHAELARFLRANLGNPRPAEDERPENEEKSRMNRC